MKSATQGQILLMLLLIELSIGFLGVTMLIVLAELHDQIRSLKSKLEPHTSQEPATTP